MTKEKPHRLLRAFLFVLVLLGLLGPGGITRPERAAADSGGGYTYYFPFTTGSSRSPFHYGVLESAGFVQNPADFERSIRQWQSHGLDTALLINMIPDLSVSDRMNFKVVASPLNTLYQNWYFYEQYHNNAALCGGNITIDCARSIIGPIVEPIKKHPSVIGYYIFDDAEPKYKERIRLANQVFYERDSANPASPGLLELSLGQTVYEHSRPKAFITYDYPVLNAYPACDFTKGLTRDWVDRTRETMQAKPMTVPFWPILQAHGSPNDSLRTPTVEEARLLNWLALGEDAKGIFWFTWSTDQFWTGIKDNPALLAEITSLASRVNRIRQNLLSMRKISDKFYGQPNDTAYVSTLKDFATGKLYAIVANQSCRAQTVSITSPYYSGRLKDMESGEIINLGDAISLRGGDGRLYELVNAAALPLPAPQANLVKNASFEADADANNIPDGWSQGASAARDTSTAHSGSASLRVTGPTKDGSQQVAGLKPGTKYYISWYMRGQNLTESQLGLQYWQTSPSTLVLDNVQWVQNGSFDWVKRVGFFTTPDNYAGGTISIAWDVKAGAAFWVDDLTICEAGKPCPDAYLIERER